MIDFHVHPHHSIDSHAEPAAMVRAAVDKGLRAICFTTHIDLNPRRECLDYFMRIGDKLEWLSDSAVDEYCFEIAGLKDKFAGQIDVWTGFELSYGWHFEDRIARFLERHDADFVLGAVHCLDSIAITSRAEAPGYFRSIDAGGAIEAYCNATAELARSGLFTTVAHIDGIKKYARAYYGDAIDRELEIFLPEVLAALADMGVGIEINTSAMRRGHPDFYPSRTILEFARDAGVKVNSIGSDGHRVHEVGYKLGDALSLIREVGIGVGEPLAGFLERKGV